ncbi:MAG: hypothetical protein J6W29_07030 [Neisseriaceae bacterium]|nr:hypothetical protein [Neisseriaceae bacterium]
MSKTFNHDYRSLCDTINHIMANLNTKGNLKNFHPNKKHAVLGRACMGACFFLCILKNAYPIALFNKANPRSVLSLPQTERAKNRV